MHDLALVYLQGFYFGIEGQDRAGYGKVGLVTRRMVVKVSCCVT
jgi:hypothetical protein